VEENEYLDININTGSYTENCSDSTIYACAVGQFDCLDEGSVSCGTNLLIQSITKNGFSASCNIDEAEMVFQENRFEYWLGKGSTSVPLCDLQRAGPYICSGDLNDKDTNLLAEQESIEEDGLSKRGGEISRRDNYLNQVVYGIPFTQKKTNLRALELGLETSATQLGFDYNTEKYGYEMINVPGATGAHNMNMQTTALPTILSAKIEYEDVNYHCVQDGSPITPNKPWACPINAVPDPEIIDLDSLKIDASCSLDLSQECKDLIGVEQPSETFAKILGAAGTEYNIPASALIAFMKYARSFDSYAEYFSTEEESILIQASLPWYGTFDEFDCNETEKQAIGPYDWIEKWFKAAAKNTGAKDDINRISTGRGETLSRCNFFDATYVAAADLGGKTSSCGGFNETVAGNAILALAWGDEPQGNNAPEERKKEQHFKDAMEIFRACR